MTKKIKKPIRIKCSVQKLWRDLAFRLTSVSSGVEAVDSILVPELSKFAEKAIDELKATWNSVKKRDPRA